MVWVINASAHWLIRGNNEPVSGSPHPCRRSPAPPYAGVGGRRRNVHMKTDATNLTKFRQSRPTADTLAHLVSAHHNAEYTTPLSGFLTVTATKFHWSMSSLVCHSTDVRHLTTPCGMMNGWLRNKNTDWEFFRIGTARYAVGLRRMQRHGPVIVHCTDSEDFPTDLTLNHQIRVVFLKLFRIWHDAGYLGNSALFRQVVFRHALLRQAVIF